MKLKTLLENELIALNDCCKEELYIFEEFPNKKLSLKVIDPKGRMTQGTFGIIEAISYREMSYYLKGVLCGLKAQASAWAEVKNVFNTLKTDFTI